MEAIRPDEEVFKAYRAGFSSDDFLMRYFGEDHSIPYNPHRGEIPSQLHEELRHLFDGVLRCMPGHIISSSSVGERFEPVYVFRDGKFADWVDSLLERRGLMRELSPKEMSDLCTEFITHCRAGALHQRAWWRWQTTDDSVWIEVIPEAIAAGKHKSRSLDELIGREK